MEKQPIVLVTTSLVSGAAGLFIGYKIAEKRLAAEFDERLKKETEGMKEFYTSVKKPYDTPQEAAADLLNDEVKKEAFKTAYHKIVKDYEPTPDDPTTVFEEKEEVTVNIFSKNERDPEFPYIISQEEFMENEMGFNEITLTYYEIDNVLVDERDDVIEDPEKVVGEKALSSFGVLSSDDHAVHICNEKLGMVVEIVWHEGSYNQLVLGGEAPAAPELPSGRNREDL